MADKYLRNDPLESDCMSNEIHATSWKEIYISPVDFTGLLLDPGPIILLLLISTEREDVGHTRLGSRFFQLRGKPMIM